MSDTAAEQAWYHTPCGLFCFDDQGVIQWANPTLHEWLGEAPQALVGRSIERMLSPASRVFHSTHLFPLLKLHGHADEVFMTWRSTNGELPVLVNARRDTSGEAPLNHCALMPVRQRTEFEAALVKARQEAEAAAAARDEFLAVVSHELRSPLSAILGWVAIARRVKMDQVMQERAFETIERNAKAQSHLIEDLLDVSRIVSGKMRLSPRPIALGPVVESAVDTVRPAAAARQIELQVAIQDDGAIVVADPDRLQQVAWNLLSNAVKFTPRGGRVQVTLGRQASRLRLQVSDTGRGLPAEQLPFLFKRFWQADPDTRRERTGLGLGLSICRSLVELHGGSIRAESAGPGHGATFTVDLPLAVAAALPAAPDTAGSTASESALALRGMRVLAVDDDMDARTMLQWLLGSHGASVRAASNAGEALELLGQSPADLMVSDLGLPGCDGLELVRRLRGGAVAGCERLPAIAVTGLARPQDRVAALRAGFQACLGKPVDPVELVALAAALGGHGWPQAA